MGRPSPGEVIDAHGRRGTRGKARKGYGMALDRGSTDNITVIVLDLRKYTSVLKNRKMVIQKVPDRA
jgi:serine/threonine protein phosphatase PrpC